MNEKQFIKQILTIKGYKSTHDAFIEEEKSNINKKKINYFVELIQSYIQSSDLDSLSRLWAEYEVCYFKYLDFDKQRNADSLKSDLYKAYLIECHRNKRTEKINQFFMSFGSFMPENRTDWADWFEFPFVKSVTDHRVFAVYYSRTWFDSFHLSLFNFFMQVMRSTMSFESRLERFFTVDMGLDECSNKMIFTETDVLRKQYNLPNCADNHRQFVDQLMSSIQHRPKILHDSRELLCDFRLTSDKKQLEGKKQLKNNKPKGIGVFIQNKTKSSSPIPGNRNKTIFHQPLDNNDGRENLEKLDESACLTLTGDIDELQNTLKDDNDSISSTGSTVIINVAPTVQVEPVKSIPIEPSKSPVESFGIRQLSNKISQRIFKPKLSTAEVPKPVLYHEHFSMVTHVKFSRLPTPIWASLDVGGTFKIWSTKDASKAINTLSYKHTIYSFDWVSCTTDLILLGSKYGSVKLFNMTANQVTNEMTIDTVHPRINIVQSFDTDAKFVCESLDHSRATISGTSLPQGVISLCDAENWSMIRESIMDLDSKFTVNCLNCWSNIVVSGCSNGCVKFLDVRVPGTVPTTSVSVFQNEEVVNIVRMCESKWLVNVLDSNIVTCFGSRSHVKLLDIRKPNESFRQEPWQVNNLTLPLSWSDRPHGGEQTIYSPRSNLISEAFLGNDVLFSAAGRGINIQKMSSSGLCDPIFVNCGHNSPVLCIDSSPVDFNDRYSAMVLTGAMEGTIAAVKVTNKP